MKLIISASVAVCLTWGIRKWPLRIGALGVKGSVLAVSEAAGANDIHHKNLCIPKQEWPRLELESPELLLTEWEQPEPTLPEREWPERCLAERQADGVEMAENLMHVGWSPWRWWWVLGLHVQSSDR